MRDHFVSEILPALTPRAVDPLLPFPLINAGSIQIALKLWFPKSGRESVALIEVPELLERFIALSDSGDREEFILCEELIIENVQMLFKGAVVRGCQLFRLTRDMDYSVNKESAEELLHELQDKLRHRRRRAPVRLEFSAQRSCKELQKYLAASLEMSDDLCFTLPDMLDFEDFSSEEQVNILLLMNEVNRLYSGEIASFIYNENGSTVAVLRGVVCPTFQNEPDFSKDDFDELSTYVVPAINMVMAFIIDITNDFGTDALSDLFAIFE